MGILPMTRVPFALLYSRVPLQYPLSQFPFLSRTRRGRISANLLLRITLDLLFELGCPMEWPSRAP